MKVCMLGSFEGTPDEGMTKFARNLRDATRPFVQLECFDPRNMITDYAAILEFRPDIIHYIPGPSPISLMILKGLKLRLRPAKTIATITHPHGVSSGLVWRGLQPDLALSFSPDWVRRLRGWGIRASVIPGAVDLSRFRPILEHEKCQYREALGVPKDKPVALHVGHLRKGRGVDRLVTLTKHGITPVIVASGSTGADIRLKEELSRNGCVVIDHYIPSIENCYQIADCYIFPTTVRWRSMDLPMSILEAMACNLPVVSTDFGSISSAFSSIPGVHIVEDPNALADVAREMLESDSEIVSTRDAVMNMSWSNLARVVSENYEMIMND